MNAEGGRSAALGMVGPDGALPFPMNAEGGRSAATGMVGPDGALRS